MTQLHTSRSSIALVLCLLVVLAGAALVSAPAAADHGDDGAVDDYVATQGDTCVELATYGDGSGTVGEFYDYRWKEPGMQFSSYGTRHLQQEDVSQLFLHHGREGVSLVLLHDELEEDYGENASGGGVTLELDGLPDGEWAVMDDDYNESLGGGPDDRLQHDGSSATVDWVWAAGRTDGAAYRGVDALGAGAAITVDPAFGDASWAGQRGYNRAEGEVTWQVRQADGDGLHSVADDQRLAIERGTCGGASLDASLTASPETVDVDQSVTLEASATTAPENVTQYRWDLDGDGDLERNSTAPTVTTEYARAGTITPEVTVVAGNETDAATVEVEVRRRNDGPEAALSVRDTVALGDTVTFDASGSTDEGTIETFRWDVGDDGTVDHRTSEPTLDHTAAATGEQPVTVTVVDDDGETAAATAAFDVLDEEAPTAVVDAPANASVGEAITLDGSASSDNDAVASHNWTIDGDAASGETVTHTFDDAGTYDVTLTVTDPSGNEDQNATTIEVEGDGGDENDSDDGSEDGNDGDDDSEDDGDDTGDDDSEDDGDDTGDDGSEDGNDGDDDSEDDGDDTGDDGGEDENDGDDADGDDDTDGGIGGDPSWSSGTDAPTATLESTDDGAFELTIEDGDVGDQVVAETDGAAGALERLELELASGVDEWAGTVETVEEPSTESGGTALYEVDPADGGPIQSVTYLFTVERSAFDGDADELVVVERNGSDAWTSLDADVEERGSTLEVRASSDALERVRLGTGAMDSGGAADGASGGETDGEVAVTDLAVSDGPVDVGETVTVTATLRNDGTTETEENATLVVDGESVAQETVAVPAASAQTVTFEHALDEPGTYDVGVGEERQTVEAQRTESENAVPGSGATLAVVAAFVVVGLALAAIERRSSS